MSDPSELAETLAGIQRGLDEADRGEGQLAREFFRELAAKHGFILINPIWKYASRKPAN
jgi:hypothetical protein